MADKVTWFELPADDTARAGAFYEDVFDWGLSDMGGGSLYAQTTPSDDSTIPLDPGAINGDISPRSVGFDKPLIVITVDDIRDKVQRVEEAGGSVAVAPNEIEGMDIIWAIVTDTEGNNIGLLQDI
jgi:predicted enzyme related to lactoylglutathione lyase